jgi:uncharacterized protein with von Willebrand factor type A (vWA) domain
MNHLPFYTIFSALRKNGFPLGIDEYQALIEVLSCYHLYSPSEKIIERNELMDICKTLWFKPNQVPLVFETIFNEQYNRIFLTGIKTGITDISGTADEPGLKKLPDDVHKSPLTLFGEKQEPEAPKTGQSAEDSAGQAKGIRIVLGSGGGQQQQFKKEKANIKEGRFLFSDNYFPVSRRQIQQLLSYLPEKKQQSAENEIDIDNTILSIARHGYLKEPIYKKKEEILNKLVMLHDHKGSMVAFENLSDMLIDAKSALFNQAQVQKPIGSDFYFQNITEKHIYLNKANTKFREMDAFIDFFREKKVMLAIVSDAGAARMSNSDMRVKLTIRMLKKLQQMTNRMVWLNPLPEGRWINTSAERIAEFVPMFSIDHAGLQQAVAVLRGK